MKQEFIITSKLERSKAVDAVKVIASEPVQIVTIDDYVLTRSGAQNKLYWAFITDTSKTTCNEHAGHEKEWWHGFFKEHSLLNIYIRDNVEGMAETMAALYEVKIHCGIDEYNKMKSFVIKNISTTWADVRQFTEYLNDISRFCGQVGIALRTDTELFKKAMGLK